MGKKDSKLTIAELREIVADKEKKTASIKTVFKEKTSLEPGDRSRRNFGDETKRALKFVYGQLSKRPRSIAETRTALKKKGFGAERIDEVVSHLINLGYLDDLKFAKWWVQTRQNTRPVGAFIMRRELEGKGISGKILDEAVSGLGEGASELDAATKLADSRLEKMQGIPKGKQKKRINDYLIRRGFKYDVIRSIVEKIR
ncbi:MAG: regulatory protein RecX [Candidatus Omnitrophica bacterium]|nr:regulatory protein RecX [Candidatus Omnitrophota bacterium]